jgi:hypothetical protein
LSRAIIVHHQAAIGSWREAFLQSEQLTSKRL